MAIQQLPNQNIRDQSHLYHYANAHALDFHGPSGDCRKQAFTLRTIGL